MASLVVQNISRAGINPTFVAADIAGDTFNNDGRTYLHVKNGLVAVNVTIKIPRTVDGQAVASPVVNVPASVDRLIGPFPPGIYNEGGALGDIVSITYDDVSNVTVGVFRV